MIYSNSIMYNDKRMQSHPCCFFFSLICVTMSLLLKSSKQRSLILVGMPSIVLLCRDQDEAELLMINGEVLAHSLLYLSLSLFIFGLSLSPLFFVVVSFYLSLSLSILRGHLSPSLWSFSLSPLFFVVVSLPFSVCRRLSLFMFYVSLSPFFFFVSLTEK